jgi:DNA-binding TFAR19-related protein (PDSD5 family)
MRPQIPYNKMDDLQEQELEIAKNLKMLEDIAKSKMSGDAISRYGNLKIAHPELAIKAVSLIAQAIQSGKVDTITDIQFKELLNELQEKKSFKFKK